MRRISTESGFSLMEVVLAVLLVSVGLLAILKVFPVAVHEAELTVVDTHEAMFAEAVLSGIEGNANATTKWADWDVDDDAFRAHMLKDTIIDPLSGAPPEEKRAGFGVIFPDVSMIGGSPNPDAFRKMRYTISVAESPDSRPEGATRLIVLKVCGKKYANFLVHAHSYVTEVSYYGL